MPLDPKRVQAVFLEAADYQDPADRATILDRECSGDPDMRRRIEALLKAHDEFNSFLNDPVVVDTSSAPRDFWRSDHRPKRADSTLNLVRESQK
jgi:hypothetical protein